MLSAAAHRFMGGQSGPEAEPEQRVQLVVALAATSLPAFLRRAAALRMRPIRSVGITHATTGTTWLVSATGILVHRRLGPTFSFAVAHAVLLIAFFNVLSHSLLLIRVPALVTLRHGTSPLKTAARCRNR